MSPATRKVTSVSTVPNELSYTSEHEWVQKVGPNTVLVGITDFAQSQLGDVVFVQLPAVDDEVTDGESFAEVESTKTVSDIYGPLSGTVSKINSELEESPELVNSDPYGDGWLVEITVADDVNLDTTFSSFLDAEAYTALTAQD